MPGVDPSFSLRPDHQLRCCHITINDDMSVNVLVEEEIIVNKYSQSLYKLQTLQFFIPFKESRFNAKISDVSFKNVVEFNAYYNDKKDRITSVIYLCDLDNLLDCRFPEFTYREIDRIQEYQGLLPEWDWENNISEKGFAYEEIWGGSSIIYNLSFNIPPNHLPIWISSSGKLTYSINIYNNKVNIYFPDFNKLNNISIVYRYAPISYDFIIKNQDILIRNQNNIKNLIYEIKQHFSTVDIDIVHTDSHRSQKALSGRPRNSDDDWAWEQVHLHSQDSTTIRKEWDRRNKEKGRELADPDRSFRHAIHPKRKKRRDPE